MPSWQGKTRGGVIGYKIFVYTLKFFGIGSAYFLLRFVIVYYLIFDRKAVRSVHYYFRHRLNFGFWKSKKAVYKNIYIFGQTLIDKVAILSGLTDRYTYDFENEEILKDIAGRKKGGIVLGGHFGNWEIAGHFLAQLDAQVSILMYDEEHRKVKEYLSGVMVNRDFKVIPIKEDGSHLFEIRQSLNDGRLVAMHGDRFVEGNEVYSTRFLGEEARFPIGPYHLAARFKVPVLFVYAMKEKNYHYHLYAEKPMMVPYPGNIERRRKVIRESLEKYVSFVENVVREYPYQWFNYYDFWKV